MKAFPESQMKYGKSYVLDKGQGDQKATDMKFTNHCCRCSGSNNSDFILKRKFSDNVYRDRDSAERLKKQLRQEKMKSRVVKGKQECINKKIENLFWQMPQFSNFNDLLNISFEVDFSVERISKRKGKYLLLK